MGYKKNFILSTIKVDSITIATLIKLLAISMVASSFFGFSSNCMILKLFMFLDSERFFLSDTEREKKATSAPEIIADKKTNTAIMKILMPRSKEIG